MKQVLAFRLEAGETLCGLLEDYRSQGIHLKAHTELPGGLHLFEDREPAVIQLSACEITMEDRMAWDFSARNRDSRRPFYRMRGTVDPLVDIFPFPPVMKFYVEGVEVEVSVNFINSKGGGDSLQMHHKGELIASTGATMGKWVLRIGGFQEYNSNPALVKAAMTAIKFLDEKLYDDVEDAA